LFLLGGVDTAPPAGGDSTAPPAAARPAHESNRVVVPNLSATTAAGSSNAPSLPDHAIKWKDADLSKRSFVQREDDSVPWPKDAPPPAFTKATMQAIRAAATPGVEKCKSEIWKTYPDLAQNPDIKASISVVYTAQAAGGAITIPSARVVVNGFPDDNYAKCVQDAFEKLQVASPAGQSDGKGQVVSSFVGKD
jgi:hypothetical protein